MSRLGKKLIALPEGVKMLIETPNVVTLTGPKGTLKEVFHPDVAITTTDNEIKCSVPTKQKRHKELHGLTWSLLSNMVKGVFSGYKLALELVGVGYKVNQYEKDVLEFHLGYAHPIFFKLPPEVHAKIDTARGKNPTLYLESINKQLIGQVAAKIKSFRKTEPYKGKGIQFVGESIRRKAGKTAAK